MAWLRATRQRTATSTIGWLLKREDCPVLLLRVYILGLPLWWLLGVDFLMPLLLPAMLLLTFPAAHRRFAIQDYVLGLIIVTLITSAYLNGLLISQAPMRFLAALYNAAIWACGLILIQQVRAMLQRTGSEHQIILLSAFRAFLILAAIAWGSFVLAYVLGRFNLATASVLGLGFGKAIPDSAVLIKQSVALEFTQADWGLPGVPMPRLVTYAPYPNATAAIAAVLGTLALFYLYQSKRDRWMHVLALEGLIIATLTITLSRAILAGWLVGMIAANLLFGTAWRRLAGCLGLAAAIMLPFVVNIGQFSEYRQYSTESRTENYVLAIEETALTHPCIGLGIKPREEGRHIAVGSHSTFVSAFTKGGILTLSLVVIYLVIIPVLRWITAAAVQSNYPPRAKAEMRILLNLQVAIWLWLCFEDIDAPATAAILIFLGFAFIEAIPRSLHAYHRFIPALKVS